MNNIIFLRDAAACESCRFLLVKRQLINVFAALFAVYLMTFAWNIIHQTSVFRHLQYSMIQENLSRENLRNAFVRQQQIVALAQMRVMHAASEDVEI